jgi:ketosteroid isomerase-like protein
VSWSRSATSPTCATHIALTITPPGGAPVRRTGYTVTILRKEQDGRGRLTRDANVLSNVD